MLVILLNALFVFGPIVVQADTNSQNTRCVLCGDSVRCGNGLNDWIRTENEVIKVSDYCKRISNPNSDLYRFITSRYQSLEFNYNSYQNLIAERPDLPEAQQAPRFSSNEAEPILNPSHFTNDKNNEHNPTRSSNDESDEPNEALIVRGAWHSPKNPGMVNNKAQQQSTTTGPTLTTKTYSAAATTSQIFISC